MSELFSEQSIMGGKSRRNLTASYLGPPCDSALPAGHVGQVASLQTHLDSR